MLDVIGETVVIVLVGTYGKTAHAWLFDGRDLEVPVGIPELAIGYAEDEQIAPSFVAERNKLFRVNSTQVKEKRVNITIPEVLPGPDSWKMGFILQYGLVNSATKTAFTS